MFDADGLRDLNVLVVDDDPVVRELIIALLGKLGITCVESANNGSEALSILADRGRHIHLLITDLMMPDKDGMEILFAVKETPFHGKVIIVSSAHTVVLETAKLYARRRGIRVIGLLRKPFFPEDLRAVLATC